ncbi:ABC transporter permease [Deinococcus pimensis]|uniref:ABC transporter permease n=1 Tax=Deinococcus pimensis TaxID=309888 RepID=UPI0004887B1A|nr:ABC transporter permease [Deinococcus pimensis]
MRLPHLDPYLRFLLLANLVIVLFAALRSGGTFVGIDNLQSMATQLPELGLLALAVMLAMISGGGGIDLSVVATANLAAITAGLTSRALFSADEQATAFTLTFVAVALLVGAACGFLNGLLVSGLRFAPILATLGTLQVYTGVAIVLTSGTAVIGFGDGLTELGGGTLLGLPYPMWVFLIVAALLAFVLGRTRFGLRLYLMGTNAKAAHFAGIRTRTIVLATYTLSGLLAATSGILFAARANSAKADYGSSYLLIAILIAVMGGVNPSGGFGRVLSLVLAAVALQFVSSTMNLLSLSNFLKDFTWGLLLLLSVVLTNSTFRWWTSRPRKEVNAGT